MITLDRLNDLHRMFSTKLSFTSFFVAWVDFPRELVLPWFAISASEPPADPAKSIVNLLAIESRCAFDPLDHSVRRLTLPREVEREIVASWWEKYAFTSSVRWTWSLFGANLKVKMRCSPGANFNWSGSVIAAKPSYSFKLRLTNSRWNWIGRGKPLLQKNAKHLVSDCRQTARSYFNATWRVISLSIETASWVK